MRWRAEMLLSAREVTDLLFDGKQSVPLNDRGKAKHPKLQMLVAGRASATQTCTAKALPAGAATWLPLLSGARTAWSPRR